MAKKTEMLGVIFDKDEHKSPSIDAEHCDYYIPFDKHEDYFDIYENYVAFIKGCESLVRKHSFYSKYIKYLIDIVGIRTCQVLSNIEVGEDKKKVTIEMHHGPILTLFDHCAIVLNYFRSINEPNITTFKVANTVIEEHRLNNVRVVLLSKSVHQQVHSDNIMLNYNVGFGDTATFLKKYAAGIDRQTRKMINTYIEWSKSNDCCDNHVLEISDTIKKYDNDFDDFNFTI